MPLKNRTQEIANFALAKARARREDVDYKRYAKRLPSMILRNGFALTIAFLKSKKDAHKMIYEDIQEWFKKRGLLKGKDLLGELLDLEKVNAVTYRLWSKEALELATWLQRMVEAEIKEEK